MVDTAQQELIDQLRQRLDERAWLADDRTAYREGVEDTLEEIVLVLDDDRIATRRR